MTFYDRTLARMSRRELMKRGWLLGAAAVAPPLMTRRLFAKPIFDAGDLPPSLAPTQASFRLRENFSEDALRRDRSAWQALVALS